MYARAVGGNEVWLTGSLARDRKGSGCSDETELIGDQRWEPLAVTIEVAEESIDCWLEVGTVGKRSFQSRSVCRSEAA